MNKYGDEAVAAAIKVAHEKLEKLGWRYSFTDIGINAKYILDAIYEDAESKK